MINEPPDYLFSMDGIQDAPLVSLTKSATCQSGMMAEMLLATEAASRGFCVFFPIGHSQKADLVIWKPPFAPITIQVKKATRQKKGKGQSYKFMVGSGRPSCAVNGKDYGLRYVPYMKGDFDVLCAYILERNSFLFYYLDEVVGRSCITWSPDGRQRENNWDIFQ